GDRERHGYRQIQERRFPRRGRSGTFQEIGQCLANRLRRNKDSTPPRSPRRIGRYARRGWGAGLAPMYRWTPGLRPTLLGLHHRILRGRHPVPRTLGRPVLMLLSKHRTLSVPRLFRLTTSRVMCGDWKITLRVPVSGVATSTTRVVAAISAMRSSPGGRLWVEISQ